MARSTHLLYLAAAAASLARAAGAAIQWPNLIVVRLGDASHNAVTATAGAAQPVYLDEYAPGPTSATLVQSIALSTSLCTLGNGAAGTYNDWAKEGFPSISGNGLLVSFGCYRVALGTVIGTASSVLKTLAYVNVAGNVDTSTSSQKPYFSSTTSTSGKIALHAVATQDGTTFWLGMGPGYTCGPCYGSYNYVPYGGSTANYVAHAAGQPGYNDGRFVGVFNGQLYGTDSSSDSGWNGLFTIGSGLPTTAVNSASLSGTVTGSPWGFVFENTTSVWIADDGTLATFNVRQWMATGSAWTVRRSFSWTTTAVYSIAGRYEAGSGFVLYGTTPTTLYRYVVSTSTSTALATSASTNVFRGVAIAPAAATPTASPTATQTPSPSQTASKTSTTSQTSSQTASQTATNTQTSSPSSTTSASASLSAGASPSNTASASTTGTPSPSQTETPSSSHTGTPSSSQTGTQTHTSTPSASITASQSGTPTSTRTSTPSASITASQSGTPTSTRTSTPSASITASQTASRTWTPTNTASATKTPPNTPSRTGTPSLTPTLSPFKDKWSTAGTTIVALRINNAGSQFTASGNSAPGVCPGSTATCSTTVVLGSCLLGTWGAPYTYGCNLFLDELSATTGAVVQTLSVTGGCTQFWGTQNYAQQGLMTLSGDGRYLTIPCNSGTVKSSATKQIVRVYADGTMSTTAVGSGPYSGASWAFHAAASADGTSYWLTGTSSSGCTDANGGLRYVVAGGSSTTAIVGSAAGQLGCGVPGAGVPGVFNGQLYASFQDTAGPGLYTIGSGVGATGATTPTALSGFTTAGTPWGFVFQSSTSVWVADSANVGTAHIFNWQATAGVWSQISGVHIIGEANPVYSITGRVEAATGDFVLFAVAVSLSSDYSKVYRYDTVTGTTTVLASTSGNGAPYRSVALPPLYPSASASPTPSVTGSNTASISATATNTPSNTPSPSNTASATASSSNTPSGTITPTSSLTASGTPSPSETSSHTPSSSITASGTATPSASLSTGATPSQTLSPTSSVSSTATSTGTPTSTRSATGSATVTPTNTRSSTGSATQSRTATASSSQTASPSNTQTGTRTATKSATLTSSATRSATYTPTLSPTRSANVNQWGANSIVVLRINNGGAYTAVDSNLLPNCPGSIATCSTVANGNTCVFGSWNPTSYGCSLFLDELSPSTGTKLSSLALPSTCSLFWTSAQFVQEGFATNSADGNFIDVPCFTGNPPAVQASGVKQILRVGPDGSVATSQFSDAYTGGAWSFRSVASNDGTGESAPLCTRTHKPNTRPRMADQLTTTTTTTHAPPHTPTQASGFRACPIRAATARAACATWRPMARRLPC